MLCGTAGCTEGAKMSGSAGKMGGAEMRDGLKERLLNKVKVTDKFWRGYQELVMDTVIPYQEKILNDEIPGVEKSHALANFRIAAGLEEGEFYGMVFQDSDVAKWLEGVAYALEVRPDAELEERADKVIEIIEKAQQDDGYLNTFFTIKEPEHRWQNLQECHELSALNEPELLYLLIHDDKADGVNSYSLTSSALGFPLLYNSTIFFLNSSV